MIFDVANRIARGGSYCVGFMAGARYTLRLLMLAKILAHRMRART